MALGLAAAGCTIVAPIQEPEHDRRFALKVEDTEQVPCVDRENGQARLCTAELKDSLDNYYGDLARAIWETDLRRRKLVGMGLEKARLTNIYNALLWPLGAIFITKKIHHPEWSTLDTAAVAAASYGLLNSGVPERDKLYLRTASRMACAMVVFEPLLYRKADIGTALDKPAVESPALQSRINHLSTVVDDFEASRDVLVATLKAKPGKPAAAVNPSSIAAVRSAARADKAGGGTAAGDLNAFLPGFKGETDRMLAEARAQLLEARKTVALLDASGTRLRQQRSALNFALNEALAVGTPALVSPETRAKEIASVLESHLAATKAFNEKFATLTKQSGTAKTPLWTVSDLSVQALDEASQRRVLLLWGAVESPWRPALVDRPRLLSAQSQLMSWMDRHQSAVQSAGETAKAMGCSDSTLDDFSKQLLKLVGDAAMAQPPAPGASR